MDPEGRQVDPDGRLGPRGAGSNTLEAFQAARERGSSWEVPWDGFLEAHRGWWDRVGGGGPVYCLEPAVIDSLASAITGGDRHHRSSPPLLGPEDADAERDFFRTCRGFSTGTVGVLDGHPVDYPLLGARRGWDIARAMKGLGWDRFMTPAQAQRQSEVLTERADQASHQLLAYAGRLSFDAQYRGELAGLKERWSALEVRPALPFVISNVEPQSGAKSTSVFHQDLLRFLRRWGLKGLVTWDLPDPQGPLQDVPLGLAARLLGNETPATFYPGYYDVPSGTDLRGDLRESQRRAARDAGIEMRHPVTDTSRRAGRASTAENAFRIWFVERAVTSRYGQRRGLVARLIPTFCELLHCSEDRVKSLRAEYRGLLPARRSGSS